MTGNHLEGTPDEIADGVEALACRNRSRPRPMMRQVQDALASIGIEAFPGAWKPTPEHTTAPDQYIVYTTMTYEDEHWDDEFRCYRVYVYLNLWSRIDPTEALRRIHAAMRQAGFAFSEENDSYNDDTDYHLVAGTWIINVEDTV